MKLCCKPSKPLKSLEERASPGGCYGAEQRKGRHPLGTDYIMKPILTAIAVTLAFAGFLRAEQDEGWISLFDGRSLSDWKASGSQSTWHVRDSAIVADGPRSHLFFIGKGRGGFANFEFSAEIRSSAGANSSIYFHTALQPKELPTTGMEVQINNAQSKADKNYEFAKTGSLCGIRNLCRSIVQDNEWFTMAIRVSGHRVQVRLNNTLVVDYLEPSASPEDPAYLRRLGSGTFALHTKESSSKVEFRNLRVRPLNGPVADADASPAPPMNGYARQVLRLNHANFPLVNLHAHLKGGLTLPGALEQARASGISLGIAVNCGLGFSITNDAGVADFLKMVSGQPVFAGMQAEGREWVTLFSREAAAKFDYVFTDAMTFFDASGKRTRLWMKDEVTVGDKQAFMEMLVARTVKLLSQEPIDIYVNPTFLPEVIAKEYDTLWTPERMRQVINAAVKHDVAIEINARYRIPSPAFLKLAKQAGAKFSFGTNNTGDEIGGLDYCLEMIDEIQLTADDIFTPKPNGKRAVQVKR